MQKSRASTVRGFFWSASYTCQITKSQAGDTYRVVFRPEAGLVDQTVWRLLAVTAALHLVFAVWPSLDIAVSRYFLMADGSFWLSKSPFAESIRMPLWLASFAVAILSVVMLGASLYLGQLAQTSTRLWAFIAATYAIGPGILVNGILKQNWGRARPVTIAEFGGNKIFTPPFEIADQCARNCSFVSGEAASAMVMIFVLAVCFGGAFTLRWRYALFTAFAVVFVVASGMRVGAGRHFLSDVLFAGLFMLVIARMCYLAFAVKALAGKQLPAAILADLCAATKPTWQRASSLFSLVLRERGVSAGETVKQEDIAEGTA